MRTLDKYYDFVRCNPDYKSFEEYWKGDAPIDCHWTEGFKKYACSQAYELAQAQKVIEDLTDRIKALEDVQAEPNQQRGV